MNTLAPVRRRRVWPGISAFPVRPFQSFGTLQRTQLMPTDIEKTDDGLEFTVSLPGYEKDNVQLELKDGYLSINASTESSDEQTEETETGKYIRRERFSGSCRRAFYVGEEILEDEIKAKFEDGVLKVSVPFQQPEEQPEEKKLIEIEG